MKIIAIKCKNCGDIIWSRAQHDFHECTCGSVAIDGGMTDFVRMLGDEYEMYDLELDITEQEAYEDWNFRKNNLGIIHTDENVKFVKDLG